MEQREPMEREFVIASERKGEYPFTREDSFERKMRRHRRRHAELGEQMASPRPLWNTLSRSRFRRCWIAPS
jgi:hypothetical protein